jgi:CubicO group peptidase (beta-lactamase class C family)
MRLQSMPDLQRLIPANIRNASSGTFPWNLLNAFIRSGRYAMRSAELMRDVSEHSFLVLSCAALCLGGVLLPPPAAAQTEDLSTLLANIRKGQKFPGASAVVMKGGKVVAEGATGVRRLGDDATITADNRFAVGSVTKRMTAYLVARLVEDGKLSLNAKLGEVLKDVPMRDEYRAVTLAQLLAFSGGIAGYERIGPRMTPELFDTTGSVAERDMLAAPMVSRATGSEYTALMDEYVFRPLGMTSAGWGRPWSADRKHEPWLHVARPEGHAPEPDIERPPEVLFRAAGNAHMSMQDLTRFANEDMLARRGKGRFLKSESLWNGIEGTRATNATERTIQAGGTPWLSSCYAVWPVQGVVAAIAVNGGTPEDAACKAFAKEVETKFIPVKT